LSWRCRDESGTRSSTGSLTCDKGDLGNDDGGCDDGTRAGLSKGNGSYRYGPTTSWASDRRTRSTTVTSSCGLRECLGQGGRRLGHQGDGGGNTSADTGVLGNKVGTDTGQVGKTGSDFFLRDTPC
jgi:hypothetical protein